jgi:flagellar motor switch/type III secretory pathway protein FliN
MSAASTSVAPAQNPAGEHQVRNEEARWRPVLALNCRLTVDISLPHFKVADFLRLHPGTVIPTGWGIARDVPLRVNGILIGWGELEGAGSGLALRVTELA